ncbi:MAG: recombinase RecA [Myxococcales bacterium]|nr:recombinase RecA [Myxococcales bacterium]
MIKNKLESIRNAISEVEKRFGQGAIMMLGANPQIDEPIPVIASGSTGLDRALGVGGLPRGRIIEIYGPEASGKTTLALHALAAVQREGGVGAIVDAEHALDPRYARALGINIEQLLISQPDNGEQALEIVETLLRSEVIDLVVVDSVAALVPRAEIEGDMGDAHMGLQARLMSQAMRKLTGHAAKSRSTLIFINQTRQKIGVTFGSPETTTGGTALKFYASVRLDIRRIGSVKDGERTMGNRVRVKVVKNKLAPPFRDTEFDIMYGRGISQSGETIDLALEKNLLSKSGAWFALGELKLGQGREKARAFLDARPSLLDELKKILRSDKIDVSKALKSLGELSRWHHPDEPPSPSAPPTPSPPETKKSHNKPHNSKAA